MLVLRINMDESHLCPLCLKTYQRHDLLLRHRRRCQGFKSRTRRKACNACVQAKAKCSYTRPCGRCTQRAISCEYAQPSDPDPEDQSQPSTGQGELSSFHLSVPLTGFIEPAPSLDTGTIMQGAGQNAIDPLAFLDFPIVELEHPLNGSTSTSTIQYSMEHLVQVLQQYPKSLLRDDFNSPFLHRSLYDEDVPDMTTLAKTSMAICCGSAMETVDGARFARHAMDAERQRLIQSFPMAMCMQQWDALHAMLVYGVLELRSSLQPRDDAWKQKSHFRGLKDPFLAKMTRSFVQSHLDVPGFDLTSTATRPSQTWEQWSVAETARRTIFLANLLHFLSNHDLESGESLPYYEPLNDELIYSMPLPCDHILWTARTEQDWRVAMDYCQKNAPPSIADLPSTFHLGQGSFTLQYVLCNFSKDYLQTTLVHHVGFGGSDELRNFIILCALKQFT